MKRKIYSSPEAEITVLDERDAITTSEWDLPEVELTSGNDGW